MPSLLGPCQVRGALIKMTNHELIAKVGQAGWSISLKADGSKVILGGRINTRLDLMFLLLDLWISMVILRLDWAQSQKLWEMKTGQMWQNPHPKTTIQNAHAKPTSKTHNPKPTCQTHIKNPHTKTHILNPHPNTHNPNLTYHNPHKNNYKETETTHI